MNIVLSPASVEDAPALAALHTRVADHLTDRYGKGPWSSRTSIRGVLYAMRTSSVYVARQGTEIVATLRLTARKPWAIETSHFTPCTQPVYLIAMAVVPARQRQGIGRLCIQQANKITREWPADFVRLDSYDANAGAGGFYQSCGYAEVGRASYRDTPLVYFECKL